MIEQWTPPTVVCPNCGHSGVPQPPEMPVTVGTILKCSRCGVFLQVVADGLARVQNP